MCNDEHQDLAVKRPFFHTDESPVKPRRIRAGDVLDDELDEVFFHGRRRFSTCSIRSEMSPVYEAPEEDVDVVKHSSPVVPKGPRRYRQHLSGDKRRKSSGSRRSDQTPLIEEDSSRSRSRHSHYGTNDDSSSSDLDSKAEISTSVAQWTKRQWQILLVVLTATCSSSFAVCLFPPFFPRLAEEKNATATIYGFVIGTNCLTSFIVTPIIGKNVGC